ncbi:galnt1 protein [Apostichopus japonicus]|uniref:Galnt1 protein n=1 Tax=Stichopus japonicus TaxID=307972 RepID=A0A2G8KNU8_STIJA|nr:galnt1 protein [Apostichopus japonicus]
MISRRGLRTIRRRCLRSKTTLLFVAVIALYFWRQRSLISTSDASYQREFDLQHRDDYYAYQYGVGKNEKDDGAKGILLEDGKQENIQEELDAGQFEEEGDSLNGFEKIKKNLGIEVEEEEAEVEEEQNVRDLFQLNKAFQNGKSKQNALNKLKEILGLPPDDDAVYDGSLIADPIDKMEADDNEEEINGGKKKGKLGKLKKKIKLKPLDFEIGEIDRDLPDVRPNECKHKSYPDNLPTASIIIVFYDEGLKTLLRTVHSIVNRSPPHLISEIILIDDYSTREHYTNELKVQLRQINYPIIIRRTKQRFGWVLARIQGAEYAKGDVLIFLDAHTEVTEGWLEPICARIADDGFEETKNTIQIKNMV